MPDLSFDNPFRSLVQIDHVVRPELSRREVMITVPLVRAVEEAPAYGEHERATFDAVNTQNTPGRPIGSILVDIIFLKQSCAIWPKYSILHAYLCAQSSAYREGRTLRNRELRGLKKAGRRADRWRDSIVDAAVDAPVPSTRTNSSRPPPA